MYELIADNYSSIFPLDDSTIEFIDSRLARARKGKILDIGCATGDLAIALSDKGYTVLGVDLDERMIDIAVKKGNRHSVSFKKADMMTLDRDTAYDCILCLGNTMPHVSSWQDLGRFIELIHAILADDGVFIFQILNYDKILADKNVQFPIKEGRDFAFTRRYTDISEERITFVIEIHNKVTNETRVDSTRLLPIAKSMVLGLLAQTGFERAEIFSDYDGSPASDNDYYDVYAVRKRAHSASRRA